MNYFHLTVLIAYYACRFGDLEREAQELGLQRAIEVISLFSKLYPFVIDDVTTIPFAQVCFNVYDLACEQALLFGRVKRVSRERTSERRSLSSAPRSRVLARLTSLAQIGELARRLCKI